MIPAEAVLAHIFELVLVGFLHRPVLTLFSRLCLVHLTLVVFSITSLTIYVTLWDITILPSFLLVSGVAPDSFVIFPMYTTITLILTACSLSISFVFLSLLLLL